MPTDKLPRRMFTSWVYQAQGSSAKDSSGSRLRTMNHGNVSDKCGAAHTDVYNGKSAGLITKWGFGASSVGHAAHHALPVALDLSQLVGLVLLHDEVAHQAAAARGVGGLEATE